MIALFCALLLAAQDPDTDRDGLSDFHEVHKHRTDPRKADTDGDGVPDGDPDERREFTYTVRALLHVMPPFDRSGATDDGQDARVLREAPDHLEVEFILYPFSTAGEAIEASADWRRPPAALRPDLAAGVTTNWDDAFRRRLLADLKADGIDAATLDDRALVERASRWLMDRARFQDGFTTFMLEFPSGRPRVLAALRARFDDELKKSGLTADEQFRRELFGKGMYETRSRGSCTSSAVYLTTCLRGLGLPTRMVLCFPVIDASDPGERALVAKGLTHHRVRCTVETAAAKMGDSWCSHTFNEVWVGGRWRRLNYARLGQPILDAEYLGLMVHVHTFRDLADAKLAPTWGLRSIRGDRGDVFGHSNPYSCTALEDRFGAHARVPNPAPGGEYESLTVRRVWWWDDPAKPSQVQMTLDAPGGHLVLHVDEGAPCGSKPPSFGRFYEQAGKEFTLRADGRRDVRARAERGFWEDAGAGRCDFYVRIPPEELKHLAPDVAYRLAPRDAARWRVADGVTVVREKGY